ncbi:helix-turn-helix domain-containing protein [Brotaphodocola sp.]|uniref:helix-turn-helix domain-containing protein n=1 Tax=Brotaphodocola sp. TaxID=3073577 RepID=UPI003D7E5C4B
MKEQGGYGIVFQKIMRNKNLSPEAKAIYAYLCSFAGSGETCHPSVDTMSQELGMSKGRLSKYMKELIACGVVERTRSINKNLLSGNVYRITHNVEVDFAENANCDFSSVGNVDFDDFGGIKNKGVEKRRVSIGSVENLAPNINSINNNNINNNSINNNISAPSPKDDQETETHSPEANESAPACTGIKIILNDKSFYDVPVGKLAIWREAYPAVDVESELKKMTAWCDSNPTKRKTRRGVEAFINNWLSRAQDRGGSNRSGQGYQRQTNAGQPDMTVNDYLLGVINGQIKTEGDDFF